MLPMVMLKKMAAEEARKVKQTRRRDTRKDGHHNLEPLAAGQSRRRVGRVRTGNIKGDEESDEEPTLGGRSSVPTSPLSTPRRAGRASSPSYPPPSSFTLVNGGLSGLAADDTIDLTQEPASTDSSSEDELVETAEVDNWTNHHNAGSYHIPREGDLFDRMLARSVNAPSRTSGVRRRHRRSSARQSHSHIRDVVDRTPRDRSSTPRHPQRDGHAPTKPASGASRSRNTLHVVTKGAKRHGVEHQTTLPFKPAPARHHKQGATNGSSLTKQRVRDPNVHVVQDPAEEQASKKRKRKKHQKLHGQTYTFDNRSGFVPSARIRKAEAVQHVEDAQFIRAVSMAPEPPLVDTSRRTRRRAAASPTRHPPMGRTSSATTGSNQPSKLRDFFAGDARSAHDLMDLPEDVDQRQPPDVFPPETTRNFSADCEIVPLRTGFQFSPDTYIRKLRLTELVSLMKDPPSHFALPTYADDTVNLNSPSSAQFISSLEVIQDRFVAYLRKESHAPSEIRANDVIMHAACQALSWMLSWVDSETALTTCHAVTNFIHRLSPLLDINDIPLNGLSIAFVSVGWFLVELSLRIESSPSCIAWDTTETDVTLKQFVQALYVYGIDEAYRACSISSDEALEDMTTSSRTAEAWVCVLHVASAITRSRGNPVIHALVQSMQEEQDSMPPPQACERHWKAIFQLCALARFSKNGFVTSQVAASVVVTAWNLPLAAVRPIVFTATPKEMDQNEYTATLVARDAFIKILVARFYVLLHTWHWRLDEGSSVPVIGRLNEIFRSRRFADLHDEIVIPGFPAFLVSGDLDLAVAPRVKDTGFQVYMKIVVQAAYQLQAIGTVKAQNILKKLVIILLPVSHLVVSAQGGRAQSRAFRALYNRLSAYAVALLMDPTPLNAQAILKKAQGAVDFQLATIDVRTICIRAMMYYTILLGRKKLDLDPALQWAGKMTDNLVIKFDSAVADTERRQVTFTLALLLRSLVKILTALFIDQGLKYPCPGLLTGSWMTHLLKSRTGLKEAPEVGSEIRSLVQLFLDTRRAVMPKIIHPVTSSKEDSQESQDAYGDFEFDAAMLEAYDQMDVPEVAPVQTPNYDVEDTMIVEVRAFTTFAPRELTHVPRY
jgi:hypothetical protein